MKSKKHAAPSVPTAIHSVESNKLSGPADIENIDVMSFKSAESIEVEREDQYKNTLEQSVAASNKHVFLSWNDISFGVPKSKKDIKEAISIQSTNIVETTKPAAPVVEVEELSTIFKSDVAFKKAFESLTPGRQRGYLIYFSGAKQAETRLTRIEKYRDRILAGIGITDCTCGLSKRMPSCDGSHKYLKK